MLHNNKLKIANVLERCLPVIPHLTRVVDYDLTLLKLEEAHVKQWDQFITRLVLLEKEFWQVIGGLGIHHKIMS